MTGDAGDQMEEAAEIATEAFERNAELGAAMTEAWFDAFDSQADEENYEDAFEGYTKAAETWMEAYNDVAEGTANTIESGEFEAEEVRDIWLNAANQALKDVMTTSAFAAATGDTMKQAMEMKKQMDDAADDAIAEMGFATSADVTEVGERLVEVERRIHEVESKIDRLIEEVE